MPSGLWGIAEEDVVTEVHAVADKVKNTAVKIERSADGESGAVIDRQSASGAGASAPDPHVVGHVNHAVIGNLQFALAAWPDLSSSDGRLFGRITSLGSSDGVSPVDHNNLWSRRHGRCGY